MLISSLRESDELFALVDLNALGDPPLASWLWYVEDGVGELSNPVVLHVAVVWDRDERTCIGVLPLVD